MTGRATGGSLGKAIDTHTKECEGLLQGLARQDTPTLRMLAAYADRRIKMEGIVVQLRCSAELAQRYDLSLANRLLAEAERIQSALDSPEGTNA